MRRDLARVAADVAIVADLGGYLPRRRESLRQAVAELQALPALKAELARLRARRPIRHPARPAVRVTRTERSRHGLT